MDRPLDCVMVANSVSEDYQNFFLLNYLRVDIFNTSRFPGKFVIHPDLMTNQEYFICDALLEKLT